MKKFFVLMTFLTFFAIVVAKAQSVVTHVTLTYYQPLKEQCNSEPLVTSDGSRINLSHLRKGKIRWCAVSRDLLYLFPKGKKKRVWIEGFGEFEVRDVMNRRFRHSVDILIHPKDSKRIKLTKVKVIIIQ